jgi:hypothetical protein
VRPAVDVIVDPDDDIATTTAVQELADREPGVLAISIAPDTCMSAQVVWAVLRALGKRIEKLGRPRHEVWWNDAERWLAAHRIGEVAVLCGQHLDDRMTEQLRHLARLGIAVTFVYGGTGWHQPPATTTLDAWLSRPRPRPAQPDRERWPLVPRSHPLWLRYDCSDQLDRDEFARVEELLYRSFRTMDSWLWGPPGTRGSISLAFNVVSAAADPDQAYVRRCGAEIALTCHNIPPPRALPMRLRARAGAVTAAQVDAIHAFTRPATAGYHLAKLITRLPDGMLDLIARDQITDDTILGYRVPVVLRPILRALGDGPEILDIPYGPPPDPADAVSPEDRDFVTVLGRLLRDHGTRVAIDNFTPATRMRLDELRAAEILDLTNGAYRASHIALFSSYLLPALPPPPPAEEANDLPQEFPCIDFPLVPYQLDLFALDELDGYVSEPLTLAAI